MDPINIFLFPSKWVCCIALEKEGKSHHFLQVLFKQLLKLYNQVEAFEKEKTGQNILSNCFVMLLDLNMLGKEEEILFYDRNVFIWSSVYLFLHCLDLMRQLLQFVHLLRKECHFPGLRALFKGKSLFLGLLHICWLKWTGKF